MLMYIVTCRWGNWDGLGDPLTKPDDATAEADAAPTTIAETVSKKTITRRSLLLDTPHADAALAREYDSHGFSIQIESRSLDQQALGTGEVFKVAGQGVQSESSVSGAIIHVIMVVLLLGLVFSSRKWYKRHQERKKPTAVVNDQEFDSDDETLPLTSGVLEQMDEMQDASTRAPKIKAP